MEAAFRQAYQATPEFQAAKSPLDSATKACADSKTSVLSTLGQNADYQAAVAAKKTAKDQLDQATRADQPDADQITALRTQVLTQSSAQSKLESGALAASTAVQEATKTLAAAQASLDAMRQQMEDAMHKDPKWIAAKAAVTAAQAKLAQARTALARAK